jgi:hypothetical protein
LLILAGKVVLANRATDVLQNGERLARRMQAAVPHGISSACRSTSAIVKLRKSSRANWAAQVRG